MTMEKDILSKQNFLLNKLKTLDNELYHEVKTLLETELETQPRIDESIDSTDSIEINEFDGESYNLNNNSNDYSDSYDNSTHDHNHYPAEYKSNIQKTCDLVFSKVKELEAENEKCNYFNDDSSAKALKKAWNNFIKAKYRNNLSDARELLIHNIKNFRLESKEDKASSKTISKIFFDRLNKYEAIESIEKTKISLDQDSSDNNQYFTLDDLKKRIDTSTNEEHKSNLEKIEIFLTSDDNHEKDNFVNRLKQQELSKINKSFWKNLGYLIFSVVPDSEGTVNFNLLNSHPLWYKATSAGSCFALNSFMFGGIIPDLVKDVISTDNFFEIDKYGVTSSKKQQNIFKNVSLEHLIIISAAEASAVLSLLGLTLTSTAAVGFPPALILIAATATAIAVAALLYPDFRELVSKLNFDLSKNLRNQIINSNIHIALEIMISPLLLLAWTAAFTSDLLLNAIIPAYSFATHRKHKRNF